MKLQDSN